MPQDHLLLKPSGERRPRAAPGQGLGPAERCSSSCVVHTMTPTQCPPSPHEGLLTGSLFTYSEQDCSGPRAQVEHSTGATAGLGLRSSGEGFNESAGVPQVGKIGV